MNEQGDFIILSIREYREKDALLQLLGVEGKQSMVVKGFYKPNSKMAGMLQPYGYSHLLYRMSASSSLGTLTSVTSLQTHRHIREDLLASGVAALMCEIIEKGSLNQDHYFDLLLTSFTALNDKKSPYGILCLFLAVYLRSQGIYPKVDACVRCLGTHHVMGLSIRDGGFVCRDCFQPQFDILRHKEQLKKFRLINSAQLKHLPIILESATWNYEDVYIMLSFLLEYGSLHLKSMKFLAEIESIT